MNATVFLRPVHAWFFLWERRLPSLYRVVATGLAALGTAAVLAGVGMPPLLAAPLSLGGWVALAVAQEHDERVLLPPDQVFVAALRIAVAAPPLGLRADRAHGARRARQEPWDTRVELTPPHVDGHPLAGTFITVERSEAEGWMRVAVVNDAPEALDQRLRERGAGLLADRIEGAESPDEDAKAIASALSKAYW